MWRSAKRCWFKDCHDLDRTSKTLQILRILCVNKCRIWNLNDLLSHIYSLIRRYLSKIIKFGILSAIHNLHPIMEHLKPCSAAFTCYDTPRHLLVLHDIKIKTMRRKQKGKKILRWVVTCHITFSTIFRWFYLIRIQKEYRTLRDRDDESLLFLFIYFSLVVLAWKSCLLLFDMIWFD